MWCQKCFVFLLMTSMLLYVSNGRRPWIITEIRRSGSPQQKQKAGFFPSTFVEPRALGDGTTTSCNVTITVEDFRESLHSGNFNKGGSTVTFDNLTPGFYSKHEVDFGLAGTGDFKGTYHNLTIKAIDEWGGALGMGTYPVASGDLPLVLELKSLANYIGFWLSAWDNANEVEFYNGNNLVYVWHAKDYESAVAKHDPRYYGNPRTEENKGELYVYVNFYFNSDYVNKVRFTGPVGSHTGFETDNQSAGVFLCQEGFPIVGGPIYCAK